jgi:hypothetical protein
MKVVYNTKYLEYYYSSTNLSSIITGGLQVIPSLYLYETAAYNMDSLGIKKVLMIFDIQALLFQRFKKYHQFPAHSYATNSVLLCWHY